MLDLNSLMLGTTQPKNLEAFYEKVFDKKPSFTDGNWNGFQVGKGFLTIGEHSEASGQSKEPFRIMFNLETAEIIEEFNRIKEIDGIKVIKEPENPDEGDGMAIATFADPDGNYFQLMTPWDEAEKDPKV